MIFGKRLGDKVVVVAVIFLFGMADDIYVRVFRHGQPEAVCLLAGQQARHTGAVNGRHDPILVFELALRHIQPAFSVHDIGLGSVEHNDIVDHMGHGAPVGEMPRVRRIGHSGRVVSHSQGAVTDFLGRYGHFVKGVVSVGRTQGMGVQVCNHLHGMEKPLLF